jgi:integrase
MKTWRKSLGERGLRVVLFERKPGGVLYREAWIGGKRVVAKKSLRHRDREQAKADGYQLLARLKSHQDARTRTEVTLETLFDMYIGSSAHRAKKDLTRRQDEQKLQWVVEALGPERSVRSLSPDDVERYRQARMRGECASGKRVGPRTVAADLVALNTMLNWGTRKRDRRGEPLLSFNPLRGVRLPVEKNPRRPVETYDRYLKLMGVADEVDPRLPLALTLAESTGRRIGAILKLRHEDLDLDRLPYGWLRFRAEHDKTGHEQWVPLAQVARGVLVEHMRHVLTGEWLFPSERKPSQPVDRRTMDRRLEEAYERTGLERLEGGLWHPWRRKWATERKGMPVKDVAAAGGWSDTATLLRSYQQSDEATLTQVVLEAPKLTTNGSGGTEVTPLLTPPLPTTQAGDRAKRHGG